MLGDMLKAIQSNWIWVNNIKMLGKCENKYNHWNLVAIRSDVADMLAREKITFSYAELQETWVQACDILREETLDDR